MKLYLAHPITGKSGIETVTYFKSLKETLSPYYQVLSPMVAKNKHFEVSIEAIVSTGYTHPCTTDHAIFQRDSWMVSQSDIILMDFTGSIKASIGCCMELAIGAWLNKHTIAVIPKENIHRHAFVLDAADIVFETLDEAIDYLLQCAE